MCTASYWAVIPAAGVGRRMAAERPKQYLKIQDKCLLEYALERFCRHPKIRGVVVALAENDPHWHTLTISEHEKIKTCTGGKERCHSVLHALQLLQSLGMQDDWVLVHDAARPCLREEDINTLIRETGEHEVGGVLAVPVRDTMKRAAANGEITQTVSRENLWHALTPQMFRLDQLQRALSAALAEGLHVTDEAQALEALGLRPRLIQGHPENIKVTLQSDLALAEWFLAKQERAR